VIQNQKKGKLSRCGTEDEYQITHSRPLLLNLGSPRGRVTRNNGK